MPSSLIAIKIRLLSPCEFGDSDGCQAHCRYVVVQQSLAFVATVCPDGTLNLSPKGTISVWDDDHLVFADIRSPGTITNLRKNPAVEINVVDPFARKGYRFKGTCEVIVDGELFSNSRTFTGAMGGRSAEQVESPNTRFRAYKSRECLAPHLPCV